MAIVKLDHVTIGAGLIPQRLWASFHSLKNADKVNLTEPGGKSYVTTGQIALSAEIGSAKPLLLSSFLLLYCHTG